VFFKEQGSVVSLLSVHLDLGY